jgi:hypothetical protein
MATVVEPDTLDDWRTGKRTAGCRVTAAGLTTRALPDEARVFFDRVRAAGWSRTPDPRDAPREASLRFRRADVDCLFSFYSGGLLGTEAELRVDDARVPKSGEGRYNLLVLCVPAADPGGGHTPPEHRVSGENLVKKIKEIIHEGNVRRLTIKNDEGRTLIVVPLSVGVVGAVLAPVWAAIGAVAALVTNCSIEVERADDGGAEAEAEADEVVEDAEIIEATEDS